MDIQKLNKLNNKQEREFKHKNKERLCYCCDTLQKSADKIHILKINNYDRGYGSNFDGCNIEIQLCDKCYKEEHAKWFNEQPVIIDDYIKEYTYEEDINNLIKSFPIENQEYVLNHTGDYIEMDREDWINMQLGILPDEKYKEYGMYPPSEIKAYEEKFPTCEYPVHRIYDDGSKGCWCPFEAYGEVGQKTSANISNECYYCEYYKKRETPIKDIKDEDFQDYKLYIKSQLKTKELEKKFKNL